MKRYDDWKARLFAESNRQTKLAHVWGIHDCVVGLGGGAVMAMTGEDIVADLRGRYDSPEGAAELLAELGFASLGDAVASRLPEYVHPSKANVGDLCVVDVAGPLGQAIGLIDQPHINILTPSGRGILAHRHMSRAFKV
ncbi:DUF6950 family protein [Thioclava kandeliae]|uniref:DUF6950 domain-containing protein n=1 Tax=Thioclava kandeliae TaxID=3070818 RepID=A0ABV1SFA3_9RHOB